MTAAAVVDLAADPLAYPGPPARRSELVLGASAHPFTGWVPGAPGAPDPPDPLAAAGQRLVRRCPACAGDVGAGPVTLDEELARLGAAGMAGRAPVAAVGANACPGVLRAKLAAAGLDPVVPTVRGTLYGLRISVSAHVSRPGYVPAAPVPVRGGRAAVVVGWFDADQLAGIDATEPNYLRVPLAAGEHPLRMPGWPPLPAVDVYRSRWGVVTGPGGPLPLRSQPQLFARLGRWGLEPWRSRPPAQAAAELAASADLRDRVRDDLVRRGLVTYRPEAGPRRVGQEQPF